MVNAGEREWGRVACGCALAALLHLATVGLVAMVSVLVHLAAGEVVPGAYSVATYVALLPAVQVGYASVAAAGLWKAGHPCEAKGVVIAAALTWLLGGACVAVTCAFPREGHL